MKSETSRHAMRRFWSRVWLGASLPYAVAGALLLGAILVLGREIHHHTSAIEAWIAALGP